MKLTTLIFLFALMQVSAASLAQKVTLSEKNAPLSIVFEQIRTQTGYDFAYSTKIIQNAIPVTINVKNQELKDVLDQVFNGQPLDYKIDDKSVTVTLKNPTILDKLKDYFALPIDIHGRVVDSTGTPLPGTTITVKGTIKAAISDGNGEFRLINVDENASLVISSVGYKTLTLKAAKEMGVIKMEVAIGALDQVQVIGYGITTKRLNTGSVATISSAEIDKQPVTNVLSALSGRAAGVSVTTTNGLPGGNINIQIRGKGSIAAGTAPLYIIDGVPFASNVIAPGTNLAFSAINGTISPLNSLNPTDIESISILKDADATAIYGSRGANGVVLITTKKGKSGKTTVDINLSNGISQVANLPRLLNLSQYLQIRKEAYKNDGIVPSSDPNDDNYAPDLTVWDTTKSTDWRKYLLGRTGHVTDLQGTISGGTQNTSFVIGGNYHNETTVLPGDNLYRRGGIHMALQHTSEDHKFYVQFATSYNSDNNKLSNITTNFTGDLLLPPNFPLYDASGNYNYYLGFNPLADLSAISKTNTDNIIINSLIKYNLLPGLDLKASVGYNKIGINSVMTYPTNSQYEGSTNYSYFGNNSNQNTIIEPQVTYNKRIGKSNLNLLVGATYQNSLKLSQFTKASNFNSDLLLDNISSATTFSVNNSSINYRYVSVFARANENFDDKYIINASIRRDGSSRFGPGNEFGTFGAVGAAWLFSNEEWFKNHTPFLSSGKLRGSYGITGNDQIPDYQYLSTYASSGYVYQDVAGLQPSRISNADFRWETTRKLEFALELGFLKDRILFNVDRYRNKTDDQLVSYAIPTLTGFSTYQANLPAVVENSGWEFELSTKNITHSDFWWLTTFNLTIPRNKLLSFQNLSTSSYAKTLVIGQPITRVYGYEYAGLNGSGIPQFLTQSGTISINPSSATDQFFTLGNGSPDLYGGIGNSFIYKKWSLDIFGQFAKQSAMGGLTSTPGLITNNFSNIISRWQKPGDQTNIPIASNSYAYNSFYPSSSANFFNTSYLRVKNIALSYSFPSDWLKKNKIQQLRIYLQGQNVFTFWNRNTPLYDPEAGASTNIPPMKSFVAGIQLTFN